MRNDSDPLIRKDGWARLTEFVQPPVIADGLSGDGPIYSSVDAKTSFSDNGRRQRHRPEQSLL